MPTLAWLAVWLLWLASAAAGELAVLKSKLLASSSAAPADHESFFVAHDGGGVVLPDHSLLGAAADADLKCVEHALRQSRENVTVLVAISQCLPESSLALIDSWLCALKRKDLSFVEAGDRLARRLHFATTLVPGRCKEGSRAKLAVSSHELDRLAAFRGFGRILTAAPETAPVAVISFTNDAVSFQQVERYERHLNISSAFNFHFCDARSECDAIADDNCVLIEKGADLFLYDPFTIVRAVDCDSVLEDGVPVSYVDEKGQRQCFCGCPAGAKKQSSGAGKWRCEPDARPPLACIWEQNCSDFRIENRENLDTCLFRRLSSDFRVPVPFPSDNYVADGRVNSEDDSRTLSSGPHITLSTAFEDEPVYNEADLDRVFELADPDSARTREYPPTWREFLKLARSRGVDMKTLDQSHLVPFWTPTDRFTSVSSQRLTWREFQRARVDAFDELEFSFYGRYALSVDASDYSSATTCRGCVSIVDQFRPRATTTCPRQFCDSSVQQCGTLTEGVATLTLANARRAQQAFRMVYAFGDKAVNDACSDSRCDLNIHRTLDFFARDDWTDLPWVDGANCFSVPRLIASFTRRPESRRNPLVAVDAKGDSVATQLEEAVPKGQCTRCCSLETRLREYWTDYSCGHDYDIRRCTGLADQRCALRQCLTLSGDAMAQASARIRSDVVSESQRVLARLARGGLPTDTQIHRAVACTSFSSQCSFRARITDLLELSHSASLLGVSLQPAHYVFWRYRVNGDAQGWRLLLLDQPGRMPELVFAQAQTTVALEAWTACGLVQRFSFDVRLYLDPQAPSCRGFDSMWSQTTAARRPITSDICALPGSDVAELTFEYRPPSGRPVGVSCGVSVAKRSAVELFSRAPSGRAVLERFAVQLVSDPRSNSSTAVSVTCTFSSRRADGSAAPAQCCSREFVIKDCAGTAFSDPSCRRRCAARDRAAPMQACGGKVVSHTATRTTLRTTEQVCCPDCSTAAPACRSVLVGLPLPVASDVKLCVPPAAKGYSALLAPAPQPLVGGRRLVDWLPATAFLAAMAMAMAMALVSFLRSRRRQDGATRVEDDEEPASALDYAAF
ncbi:hypothetical protein P43SY_002308 [Pythium insidiosum]|uniref:Uncharacterized protein n=1 Tax=Pythium insidiosum TaxID=114742 RepID=A0AAD5QAM7_PYTIN|nr:hypothetical protein P43SY_002308 [Pythium insidiosum]